MTSALLQHKRGNGDVEQTNSFGLLLSEYLEIDELVLHRDTKRGELMSELNEFTDHVFQ